MKLFGTAMLPAMRTMADHGASPIPFESAGSVSRGQTTPSSLDPAEAE